MGSINMIICNKEKYHRIFMVLEDCLLRVDEKERHYETVAGIYINSKDIFEKY